MIEHDVIEHDVIDPLASDVEKKELSHCVQMFRSNKPGICFLRPKLPSLWLLFQPVHVFNLRVDRSSIGDQIDQRVSLPFPLEATLTVANPRQSEEGALSSSPGGRVRRSLSHTFTPSPRFPSAPAHCPSHRGDQTTSPP